MPRWLLISLVILISLGWFGNLVVGIWDPSRRDLWINGIFGLVVGALFAGVKGVDVVRGKLAKMLDPGKPDDPQDGDPR